MDTQKIVEQLGQIGESVKGFETTAEELKELDTKRAAQLDALQDEARKRGAAEVGERVKSGKFRGATLGTLLTAMDLAGTDKGNGVIKLDGFERSGNQLIPRSEGAIELFDTARMMSGGKFGEIVDGETRITTSDNLTAFASEAVDQEIRERARDRGNLWADITSPAGLVKHDTKSATRGETFYVFPKVQGEKYKRIDRSAESTVRKMNTYAVATTYTPEGAFYSDIPLLQTLSEDMMDGFSDSLDNLFANADNSDSANVNADGYVHTTGNSTDTYLETYRVKDQVAGIRKRCLDGTGRTVDFANALPTVATLSNLVNRLPSSRPKIVATNRNTLAALMGVTEIARLADFGNLSTLLNGVPSSIFGHTLRVSDQIPMVDTDGKVTRVVSTGVLGTNNSGTILVYDPAYYEIAFEERPEISLDRIIDQGDYQLSIRGRASLNGFADGDGYTASGSGKTVDTGSFLGIDIKTS